MKRKTERARLLTSQHHHNQPISWSLSSVGAQGATQVVSHSGTRYPSREEPKEQVKGMGLWPISGVEKATSGHSAAFFAK